MARPPKKIDKREFEGLCELQCTRDEICNWFDITDKTLDAWCKRTYQDDEGKPMGFSAVFAIKRGKGKIALRRTQFRLAQKNAAMAIWLGRNYLGQSENVRVDIAATNEQDDPLSASLKALAAKLEGKEDGGTE
jgi:hypothetical protein